MREPTVGMSLYEEIQAQKRAEAQERFESMQQEQKRANVLVVAFTWGLLVIGAFGLVGLVLAWRAFRHLLHIRFGV